MTARVTQKSEKRRFVGRVRRIVVKVGSGILSSSKGVRQKRIDALVEEVVAIREQGRDVAIVTSGAIASGQGHLKLPERPRTVRMKQAVAAVGQIDLMVRYERSFAAHDCHVAQILLTRDDFGARARYLNAEHTLSTLFELSIVPIINENDSVAVEEVKFGDNDLLSALTATLVGADLLVILSDVDGLHERDPREDNEAPLIPVTDLDAATMARASARTGRFGTGGMASKLEAARVATSAGIPTVIANGARDGVLRDVLDPRIEIGTLVRARDDRLARRKHWIAFTLKPQGSVTVDQGARDAVVDGRKSLLPAGLRQVEGHFGAGDCVRCLDPTGNEFARGLVNYGDSELRRIAGVRTTEIESRLGYRVCDEVIDRDDLVVTAGEPKTSDPERRA